MSFQELQASIEATFKAYHEETSERFRRLEQVIFSERMPLRNEDTSFPQGTYDHGLQTVPGFGGQYEYFDPSSYGLRSRMREPIPSVYFRPESILLSYVGDDYEDLESFECTYIVLQPTYLSVNNGIVINEFGGGARQQPSRPHAGQPPTTGLQSSHNWWQDDDVVIGSNSGFATGGSGNPGRGRGDGSGSRPNTPQSNSPVSSSSGSSSSSSRAGSKKEDSVSSDDDEAAASVRDKQAKDWEAGDLGQDL